MSPERLGRIQIWVYAAGVLLGAVLGLGLPRLGSALGVLVYPVLVVTQTLVELTGLLVYVKLVPGWLLPGETA